MSNAPKRPYKLAHWDRKALYREHYLQSEALIDHLEQRVRELEAEIKRLRKLLSDAYDLAHGKRPPGFPIPTSAPTEWEDKRDFWRSVKEAANDNG